MAFDTAILIVSTDSSGDVAADGASSYPSLSADGRFVAFTSYATNLVPNDTNGGPTRYGPDIFVKDRSTGQILRMSVSTAGRQADNFGAAGSVISGSGQAIAFSASAGNLVPRDTNQFRDVFVRNSQTHLTTRVSTSSTGAQGTGAVFFAGGALHPSISFNSRFVAFDSEFTNLVPGDTNGASDPRLGNDIFVKDRQTGRTLRVSTGSHGEQGDGPSRYASISADGRFIAFQSDASNLVPNDSNAQADIFVKDRQTGVTTRVSVSSSDEQANGQSLFPAISANGRVAAFVSNATNLVPGSSGRFWGVFVRDLESGRTYAIRTTTPLAIYAEPMTPTLSADGRYVAFATTPPTSSPEAVNQRWQVIVKDRTTGSRVLVSTNEAGSPSNGSSYHACISASGKAVAFESDATNLVPGDTNAQPDIFLVSLPKTGSAAR